MEKPRKFSPQQLRQIRKALGLSRAQASARVGCGPRAWEHWELGIKAPSGPVRMLMEMLESEASTKA